MFGSILEETVTSVKGARAAILMGFDGIPVDAYTADSDSDIESIGMEFSVLLKEVQNAAAQLEAGSANEITIRTEKFSTILRILNDEYFMAIAVAANGNLGKARYLLRMAGPKLLEVL
ncbi:MAG: roadblock/LC7 domain-containing protein [Deltaproteobacteria bacterium]|nr:roadblock/LC7 domain-containing protein [Deltaproteobacteria bacterium]MBN2673478.1 roadblock/LC7 domain-containing protein [Deltaproteobacteria bacterium]